MQHMSKKKRNTAPLIIYLSTTTSSARNTSFDSPSRDWSTAAQRVTMNEPDGLPESALILRAHGGPEHDARVERDELHRHVRTALLRLLPRGRRVRPRLVCLGAWRVRLGQERVERRVRRGARDRRWSSGGPAPGNVGTNSSKVGSSLRQLCRSGIVWRNG